MVKEYEIALEEAACFFDSPLFINILVASIASICVLFKDLEKTIFFIV